jgi:hypothetical protein
MWRPRSHTSPVHTCRSWVNSGRGESVRSTSVRCKRESGRWQISIHTFRITSQKQHSGARRPIYYLRNAFGLHRAIVCFPSSRKLVTQAKRTVWSRVLHQQTLPEDTEPALDEWWRLSQRKRASGYTQTSMFTVHVTIRESDVGHVQLRSDCLLNDSLLMFVRS